jgi:cyclopropane fatty-acyl-phospholipid synthase-like methyltransferase
MTSSHLIIPEDFSGTKDIYDVMMADNVSLHDFIYPQVFGTDQYIGQFSDNSRDELELMANLMNLSPESKVLDVGCGRGNIAAHMASRFGWIMTGVDLSEKPIYQAIERHQSKASVQIKFIHGSIYDVNFSHSFNGIYGTGAFCHFDSKKLFKHCREQLLNGGKLAFMERVRLSTIAPADWKRLTTEWCCPYVYTMDEYKDLLLGCGFKIRHCLDFTDSFKVWQERSVTVRQDLKDEIIQKSSDIYYQSSLEFAQYENNVTKSGALGYVCIVAEKE